MNTDCDIDYDLAIVGYGPVRQHATLLGQRGQSYGERFQVLGADTVILRPDFYVYATTDVAGLDQGLTSLGGQLGPAPRAACDVRDTRTLALAAE